MREQQPAKYASGDAEIFASRKNQVKYIKESLPENHWTYEQACCTTGIPVV